MPMAAVTAETARAKSAEALLAPLASPALTGSPTAPTQTAADNTTKIATTAFVQTASGLLVPKSVVTTKGDLLVATGSGVITRLGVGSDTQVLTADSAQASGVKWAPAPGAGGGVVATDPIFTTKGDLVAATGNAAAVRLGVGSTDQVLTVDSSQATGVKWGTVPVGVRQRISFGDPWEPANFVAATLSSGRWSTMSGAVGALSTGRLYLAGGMILPKNVPVNFLSVIIGSTAGATMTHFWMCLVSQNLASILAITVDDTSASLAADTHEKLATSATYTPAADTPVYFGICAVGTTVPTLLGWNAGATGSPAEMATESPTMAGITTSSPASLTTPGSLVSVSAIATPNFRIPFGRAWS